MFIDYLTACKLLVESDNIVILAHAKPDGDTIGSSFALLYALRGLGKTARVESPDGFPQKYDYLYEGDEPGGFAPDFVVAVDIAGARLLGRLEEVYGDKIDLCIDHHQSNEGYAKQTLLDAEAAACAQVVYHVVAALGVSVDKRIADAVFTGLTTDTGCFRYRNVTADTHRVAGEMIRCGADHSMINKRMFQTKSRGRMQVDRLIMENMEFSQKGQCAYVLLPADVKSRFEVTEEDLDGIASFPVSIEGVRAGVTVRDQGDGSFRVSLRSEGLVDSSRICAKFGGGGHCNAAGCTVTGEIAQVKDQLLQAVKQELERLEA